LVRAGDLALLRGEWRLNGTASLAPWAGKMSKPPADSKTAGGFSQLTIRTGQTNRLAAPLIASPTQFLLS
jgi:hypothetical protein